MLRFSREKHGYSAVVDASWGRCRLLNSLLRVVVCQHTLRHVFLDAFYNQFGDGMTHEVLCREKHYVSHRNRQGEWAHQFFLLVRQLAEGEFRDEGHALSALHHAHEGLDAAE